MRSYSHVAATAAMWILAVGTAVASARYFFMMPRLLLRGEILALSRHHTWILAHIACGIVAISLGLFQFIGELRDAHPQVHRATGYGYLSAVFVAGCIALGLSSDTPVFAADGLADLTTVDLSFLGLSPSFLGYSASSRFSASQFFLVRIGFTTLAILWLVTGAIAFVRARQGRFDEHRAWMMRNYSLTFAAATVRLAGFPFLVLTRNPVVAITCAFWSWILNLMVVEWMIRRKSYSSRFKRRSVSRLI